MSAAWRAVTGMFAVALAGCAALQAPEPEGETPQPPAEVRDITPSSPAEALPRPMPEESIRVAPAPTWEVKRLLDYARDLRRLGSVELAREHESARTNLARTRSEYDRVRLALFFALPDTAFSDEARALELLEPITRSPQSNLNELAVLIYAFAQEQRRLKHNLNGMQEKLDALKAMERRLMEREKATPVRR